MGRIVLATSPTTDEEYGGTYPTQVETDNVTRTGNYIVQNGSVVKKNNKVVDLYVKFTANTAYSEIPAGGYTEVGSIPTKYFPSNNVQEFVYIFSGTTLDNNIEVMVTPEGKIQTYNNMNATRIGLTVHFTWITD